jgi:hypothetical protein
MTTKERIDSQAVKARRAAKAARTTAAEMVVEFLNGSLTLTPSQENELRDAASHLQAALDKVNSVFRAHEATLAKAEG